MSLYIGSIVVRVTDFPRAAAFWAGALGYVVRGREDDLEAVEPWMRLDEVADAVERRHGGPGFMPGERQIDADAELGAGRGGCAGGGACPANHQEDGRTQPGRALHAGENDSRCEAVALRILSIPS